MQDYQNMALVVSRAFGGKPSSKDLPKKADVVHRPRNTAEMMIAFNRVIRGAR